MYFLSWRVKPFVTADWEIGVVNSFTDWQYIKFIAIAWLTRPKMIDDWIYIVAGGRCRGKSNLCNVTFDPIKVPKLISFSPLSPSIPSRIPQQRVAQSHPFCDSTGLQPKEFEAVGVKLWYYFTGEKKWIPFPNRFIILSQCYKTHTARCLSSLW